MRTTTSRWLAITTGIVAAGMLLTLGRVGAFVAGLICGAIIGAAMMWADRATEREDAFNRGFMYDGPTDIEEDTPSWGRNVRVRYAAGSEVLPDPVTGPAAAQPPGGEWEYYGGPLEYDP